MFTSITLLLHALPTPVVLCLFSLPHHASYTFCTLLLFLFLPLLFPYCLYTFCICFYSTYYYYICCCCFFFLFTFNFN